MLNDIRRTLATLDGAALGDVAGVVALFALLVAALHVPVLA